jgi:hypothetical protein
MQSARHHFGAGASIQQDAAALHFLDLAGTQAARTNTDMLALAIFFDVHTAKIRKPATPRLVVGVTDVVSESDALTANVTYAGHRSSS